MEIVRARRELCWICCAPGALRRFVRGPAQLVRYRVDTHETDKKTQHPDKFCQDDVYPKLMSGKGVQMRQDRVDFRII